MKNSKLLPFSRNRYYRGKMLTSMDFEAEQAYMNNKRRFINQMFGGSGILCGLSVISLDDLSVMIESGAAVDGAGREIVVESSVVKKLSTIAGFEQLTGSRAALCIRYREEEEQPVYAVSRQESGNEYEYNRIGESYEFFLVDRDALEPGLELEEEAEFFAGGVLFENPDYRVRLRLPANICAGHYVKLELETEKIGSGKTKLHFEGTFQTPAMTTPDGSHELEVRLENVALEKGEVCRKEYWMLAQEEELSDTSLMLKAGSGRALINGVQESVSAGFNCRLNLVREEAADLALRETGRVSMEFRGMAGSPEMVRLADLTLVRTDSAYLIESVDEISVKTFIPTMRDERLRRKYESYFQKKFLFHSETPGRTKDAPGPARQGYRAFGEPRVETGIVEIPLGEHARRGDICYSGEIMHGLGKGNVYVEVGYENLEEDLSLGRNARTTVFGNPDLFDSDRSQVSAETAVKVLNDKGSFIVALRLLQDVRMLVLTYRWVAIRFDGGELSDEIGDGNARSISAVTPTVVIGAKESYFFQIKYNNMKACSITYELTEPGSGEITPDGVYTAPSREGVYEIRIYCTDKPLICTYAYAIVKKKSIEEAAQEQGGQV